jgi:predicted amidohydrolase
VRLTCSCAALLCYNCAMPEIKTTNKVTVGLVQMTCAQQPEPNLEKALTRIGEAAQQGAQIVCLQELFRSRYFCQIEDIDLHPASQVN